jgi:hypothetical protein
METSIEPVLCELQYSGAVALAVAAAGIATQAVALALPWNAGLRAWLVLLAGAMALRALRTVFAPKRLRVDGSGAVTLELRDGRTLRGALRHPCFVAPWLTIVRWRAQGGRVDRTVLVGPGMAAPEPFRRLRVRLRHG